MSRNAEWEQFIREVKENMPPRAELSAQKAVSRARKSARRTMYVKVPVAGAFVSVVVLAVLANMSPGFVKVTGNIPLLGVVAKKLTVKPSLRAA